MCEMARYAIAHCLPTKPRLQPLMCNATRQCYILKLLSWKDNVRVFETWRWERDGSGAFGRIRAGRGGPMSLPWHPSQLQAPHALTWTPQDCSTSAPKLGQITGCRVTWTMGLYWEAGGVRGKLECTCKAAGTGARAPSPSSHSDCSDSDKINLCWFQPRSSTINHAFISQNCKITTCILPCKVASIKLVNSHL